MKRLVKNYTFDPIAKTVLISDFPALKLEQLLLITNVTSNKMIYSFADDTIGGTLLDNVLTLAYNTELMSPTDALQIFVDADTEIKYAEQQPVMAEYTYDVNLDTVLGTQPLTDKGRLKTQQAYQENKVVGILKTAFDELTIDCSGMQSVAVQLSGTWVGSVSYEHRVDEGNWIVISGTTPNNGFATGNSSANNIVKFAVGGSSRFRVRCLTYTSGTIMVTLVATTAPSIVGVQINGSQGSGLVQRATTFELHTYDTNNALVMGPYGLWRQGFYGYDFPISPTINPSQPSTYTMNNFANWPQILPRLRVEVGGSKKLPLTQEDNSLELRVSIPDLYRLMEKIYLNINLQTKMMADRCSFPLPVDFENII